jgi:hypothetical protein
MRVVGMMLLGLGITLLFPCGIALFYAEGAGQVVGFLACTAVLPVPMIVVGVMMVRAAEMETDVRPELRRVKSGNPVNNVMDDVRSFDLNQLNWIGWLLLLAAFGVVIAEAAVVALVVGPNGWGNGPPRILALPMLLLPVGFFVAVRWLLGWFGVSIYRRVR